MLGDAALTAAGVALAVFSWTTGALFWIFAALVIVMNFLVDLSYLIIDPRLRAGGPA